MSTADLKSKLEAIVERLGDHFGSECTRGGWVYETSATTVEAAVNALPDDPMDTSDSNMWRGLSQDTDPVEKLVVVPQEFWRFEHFRGGNGDEEDQDALIDLIRPFSPAFAKVGGPDYDVDDGSPGLFYYCVLVTTGTGTNFLLVFPGVWT